MKGIIGRKLGMTHVFEEPGRVVPVTVVQAGPCTVLALRTRERDGYSAVQLGFGARKAKNVSQSVRGHLKAAGRADDPPAVIREIRLAADADSAVGDRMGAATFAVDEYVDVTGRTKGRGFQGVVRRHRFGGGRASHGGGWTRRPGSIGMCVSPARTYKGRKMPGHMGSVQRTVQSLRVVEVRPADDLLFIKGALPGPTGGIVVVRSACKK
jgi:large subunit ribosomal protein L3